MGNIMFPRIGRKPCALAHHQQAIPQVCRDLLGHEGRIMLHASIVGGEAEHRGIACPALGISHLGAPWPYYSQPATARYASPAPPITRLKTKVPVQNDR